MTHELCVSRLMTDDESTGKIADIPAFSLSKLISLLHQISEMLITHRRSVAERGGCFQRCLFVCHFVSLSFACQHDNFRTIKRRTTKLGG